MNKENCRVINSRSRRNERTKKIIFVSLNFGMSQQLYVPRGTIVPVGFNKQADPAFKRSHKAGTVDGSIFKHNHSPRTSHVITRRDPEFTSSVDYGKTKCLPRKDEGSTETDVRYPCISGMRNRYKITQPSSILATFSFTVLISHRFFQILSLIC